MQTKTLYDKQILKEIRDLPEIVQEKIVKIVHFFRSDILERKYFDGYMFTAKEYT